MHTLLSHTHTHAHTAPFCRCLSTCTPASPSSETLNEDRNNNRTSIAPFSSYHRYWRIYLIVHTTRLYLFKHPIVNFSTRAHPIRITRLLVCTILPPGASSASVSRASCSDASAAFNATSGVRIVVGSPPPARERLFRHNVRPFSRLDGPFPRGRREWAKKQKVGPAVESFFLPFTKIL